MTPEQKERLENLVFSPLDPLLSLDTRLQWFLDLIAEIERAAVEAERERCAQIAARIDTRGLATKGDVAASIALAIRAHTSTHE